MKIILFLIVILFNSLSNVVSQNLVVNSGFDVYLDSEIEDSYYDKIEKCNNWNKQIEVKKYSCCTNHFSINHIKQISKIFPLKIPINPISSSGLAGISTGFYNKNKKSKIGGKLQGELTESLKQDSIYCVRFYFRLAKESFFKTEELAVYFFNDTHTVLPTYQTNNIKLTPHVSLTDSSLWSKDEWACFEKVYKASGAENLFLIGNFIERDVKSIPKVGSKINSGTYKGKRFWSYNLDYYFIDDVSVFAINDEKECGCD